VVAVRVVDGEAGVLDRLSGGSHRELNRAVVSPSVLWRQVLLWVEVLDFGGDPAAHFGGVEERDRPSPGLSLEQVLPGRLQVQP
jgi:hypothetical protein